MRVRQGGISPRDPEVERAPSVDSARRSAGSTPCSISVWVTTWKASGRRRSPASSRGCSSPLRLLRRRFVSELIGDLAEYADLEPPEAACRTRVTLSTFHGCPADQIESICPLLCWTGSWACTSIVKLNPTLLGLRIAFGRSCTERLGYDASAASGRDAFDMDLQYEDGLEIHPAARVPPPSRLDSIVGAKFTNTLVVRNDDREIVPDADRSLHVRLGSRPCT